MTTISFDKQFNEIANDGTAHVPEHMETTIRGRHTNDVNMLYLSKAITSKELNYDLIMLLIKSINNFNTKIGGRGILWHLNNNPRIFKKLFKRVNGEIITDFLFGYEWNEPNINEKLSNYPDIVLCLHQSSIIWKYNPAVLLNIYETLKNSFNVMELFYKDAFGYPILLECAKSTNISVKQYGILLEIAASDPSLIEQVDNFNHNIVQIGRNYDLLLVENYNENYQEFIKYHLPKK